ncbi:MAG: hypothetical protein EX270_06980 [Pseudomonadales bacterium]|nr:MAG: hypothetical protein EX270_06980 [Pseudomonadales bacterium]
MNNRIIKAALTAAVASSAFNVSAGMLSHDYYQSLGDQQFHYVITNGSLYAAPGGSNSSEVVENQTLRVHFRSDTEGMTNRQLNCTENNDIEGEPESWRAEEVNTYLSLANGQTTENSDLNGRFCEIDIGPQGEVLGGWVQNTDVEFEGIGAPIHSIIVMDSPRRTYAWFGSSCNTDVGGPAVSITTAIETEAWYQEKLAEDGEVTVQEMEGPGSPAKPQGCTLFGISNVVIGQCDPREADTDACVTNLAKSVPVPAFAAAALGLGLLGITYLSGRRRLQA